MMAFAKRSNDKMPHLALVAKGFSASEAPTYVRIHSECITGDIFGSFRCDCGEQLEQALVIIAEKKGILIYLRQEGRGIGLINKLKAYNLQDAGLNTAEANTHLGFDVDARHYDDAIDILRSLGVTTIALLTNNPLKMLALEEAGFKVSRAPLMITPQSHNQPYLRTKKDLMGHLLE